MSIAEIMPLIDNLPHTDKIQLMQVLFTQITWKEALALLLSIAPKSTTGESMASILQRMADRQALSHITDPVAWQQEIRTDRQLEGRE